MGIVPASNGLDFLEMLESMSDKEKRVAKRKFRKAWRRFVKNNPEYEKCLGFGNENPTQTEMRNRVHMIKIEIMKSI